MCYILCPGSILNLSLWLSPLACPVTYFLAWLNNYATRASLTPYLFFGPALTMLLMVLVSIGMKTIVTALLDSVKSLKSE